MKALPDFPGANFTFQPPKGHDHDDIPCDPLRVEVRDGVILSQWSPTAKELELLNAGYPVTLSVLGNGMPPVCVYVGDGS